MPMSPRQIAILERLRRSGMVRVSALVKELGVSDMTIRRDLDGLIESGHAQRVYGGATLFGGGVIREQSLGIHYHAGSDLLDYLVDRSVFEYRDGFVARPTGPGLGIEVDEAAVAAAARTGHRWRNEVWRREDGSFAEW